MKMKILKWKRKKSWEPFGNCLLNSTANPADFYPNWVWLAVLFSRQILNGSQDFWLLTAKRKMADHHQQNAKFCYICLIWVLKCIRWIFEIKLIKWNWLIGMKCKLFDEIVLMKLIWWKLIMERNPVFSL